MSARNLRPLASSLCAFTMLLGNWASTAATGTHRHAPKHYVVVIVLDGARPDYLQSRNLKWVNWLRRHGTEYTDAFAGQVSANTPPSHATIGTGMFPRHHGVQGFVWREPVSGQAIRPGDSPQIDSGQLDRVLETHHVPSLAADVKRSDSAARVVSVSGHKCYAADAMGTPSADYILCAKIYHDRWVAQAVYTHRPPSGAINNSHFDVPIPDPRHGLAPGVEQWELGKENRWTVKYALWSFHRVHYPRVLMLNLPEMDVIGHFTAHGSQAMQQLARSFDADLGTIISAYRRAGLLARTTFVLTADHGMSPVHTRLPFSVFDDAISRAGTKKIYVEADTAAAIGIADLSKAPQVARNVADLAKPYMDAVFYKQNFRGHWHYRAAFFRRGLSTPLRSAYASLVATTACAEGPDVFAVMAPHVTAGDRIARGYHWLQGHLGPGWDEQHIPLILSGSGIRVNRVSREPARLVDIAPTLERVLGVRHVGAVMDGTVLADAVQNATTREVKRELQVHIPWASRIRALQHRSGL